MPVLCLVEAVRHDPRIDVRELLHLEQVVTVQVSRVHYAARELLRVLADRGVTTPRF